MSAHGGFHALFESRAAESPERTAMIRGMRRVSYGELNAHANGLAHRLIVLGAGPEICIGISIGANESRIAALLGILKSGAAYVPLDGANPEARLRFMCEEAGLRIVVTEPRHAALFAGMGLEVVVLDGDEGALSAQCDSNPLPHIHDGNLAYIVFTSGSTGRPKGVAIEHRSTTSLMHWARDEFGDALACVLASSSISFDMSVFEIFAPLSWGCTVVLAENILELPRIEAAAELSLISTVPSAIGELAELGWIPTTLRAALVAGEPLRRNHVRRLFAHTNVERLWNLYGVSEDTSYTTAALLRRGEVEEVISIGRPIRDREVYVLDAALRPVAAGEAGELFIGGLGLARTYVRRPELTAERFLPNPFSSDSGARMYRTGDLVRRLPDGALEYRGRTDNQIKLRGYRIETGEIEAVLAEDAGVRASVVVARDSAGGDPHLVAYVVPASGGVSPTHLRARLQERLPPWMVPAVIDLIDRLPLTAHGKLDRNSLR